MTLSHNLAHGLQKVKRVGIDRYLTLAAVAVIVMLQARAESDDSIRFTSPHTPN